MGSGYYSFDDRSVRARSLGYHTKSVHQTFTSRNMKEEMNPSGVTVRESRDSAEHPNSLAIVIALDLTGSMGAIPLHLVREGLPNIMKNIIEGGVKDPQVLFLGVGDHEVDDCPLQIGQFESSDELLDKWLTSTYLEGGGGGNYGESYLLAWYFAGLKTSIDCFEKRGQKGFLFTIGDEPTLKSLPKDSLTRIMGNGQHTNYTATELLEKARESYHVKHLHISEASNGKKRDVIDGWRQLMGDDLIIVQNHKDVSDIISSIITTMSSKTAVDIISSVTSTDQTEEML